MASFMRSGAGSPRKKALDYLFPLNIDRSSISPMPSNLGSMRGDYRAISFDILPLCDDDERLLERRHAWLCCSLLGWTFSRLGSLGLRGGWPAAKRLAPHHSSQSGLVEASASSDAAFEGGILDEPSAVMSAIMLVSHRPNRG